MGHLSSKYYPVLTFESEPLKREHEDGNFTTPKGRCNSPRCNSRKKVFLFIICVQTIALVTVSISWYYSKSQLPALSPLIYSPAQDALEYEAKVFKLDFGGPSPYKGLSDEVDSAWKDLYWNHASIKISRNEALLLPNKTSRIHAEPEYYLGGLDVFHQLHCLDIVRQALHPEYYTVRTSEEHILHCVDSIRQSLMCNADISVFSFKPSNELDPFERIPKPLSPYFTQLHQCRNFEKLKTWSQSRAIKFHDVQLVLDSENDLPDPPTILWDSTSN